MTKRQAAHLYTRLLLVFPEPTTWLLPELLMLLTLRFEETLPAAPLAPPMRLPVEGDAYLLGTPPADWPLGPPTAGLGLAGRELLGEVPRLAELAQAVRDPCGGALVPAVPAVRPPALELSTSCLARTAPPPLRPAPL